MKSPRSLIACLAAGLATLAAAAPGPADDAKIDAVVRPLGLEWMSLYNGVGLTIGIYDDGRRRIYNFGTTELDGRQAPTPETIYEIGSLSKLFTGQLLARAVIEGRARLEDEVQMYLDEPYPNLASGGERIRLIHLANMTSQLIDNIPDVTQVRLVKGEPLAATRMKVLNQYTREEFLRQLHGVAPRFEPGGSPAYSNVASMLLGVVLEKIYGEPFETLLAREIEKPLRMGSGTQPNRNRLATGYTGDNAPLPGLVSKVAWPSTALRYSADDLLTFAAWQLVERDASVKFAHQSTWYTPDRSQSVAMYWIVSDTPRGRRLQYSGGTYGFTSTVALWPEVKLAVVLLANKGAEGAQDTLRALSAKIVEGLRPEPDPVSSPLPTDVPPAAR